MARRYLDLSGNTYGRLRVVEYAGNDRLGKAMWRCVCECRGQRVVRANALRSGRTVSCGCRRAEMLSSGRLRHGLSGHSAYGSWKAMVDRCTNPKSKDYKWYGARGIKICDRWLSIQGFVAEMGERPAGCSIDRIDPNGDYTAENCRWSNPVEQGAHKRNNVVVAVAGIVGHIAAVARQSGLPETTVRRIAGLIR